MGCGIVRSVHSIKGNTLSFTTKLFSYSSFLHLRHNATRLYSIRRSSQAKYSYSNKLNAMHPIHSMNKVAPFISTPSFFSVQNQETWPTIHPSMFPFFSFFLFTVLFHGGQSIVPPHAPGGWMGRDSTHSFASVLNRSSSVSCWKLSSRSFSSCLSDHRTIDPLGPNGQTNN